MAAAPADAYTAAPGILPGFGMDVSHQEVHQILTEMEEIYFSQPTPWLGVRDIGHMLAHMWYEDMDELEDAIKGSFEDFVGALPHCETKEEGGKLLFRIKPPPPVAERRQLTIFLEVREPPDLRRVLLKSPDATVRLPHIDFEIGADNKRDINTLYNHIAVAKQNLGTYADVNAATLPAEHHLRILETVEQLSTLLDVEEPFAIEVIDPSGLSEVKPTDGARIEWGAVAVDRTPEGGHGAQTAASDSVVAMDEGGAVAAGGEVIAPATDAD